MIIDASAIISAAEASVTDLGRGISDQVWKRVVAEMRQLGSRIGEIGTGLASGYYAKEDAEFFLERQIASIKTLFYGVAEITLTLIQDAINAVISAVRTIINKAVGFAFL